MGSPTTYFFWTEDLFKGQSLVESTVEIHVTRNSSSSSSCPSPAASSCEEYEESDTEFHAETSKRKIRRKLRARDRDQEIEFLLRRKSLVLQSSNASSNGSSSKSVTFLSSNDDEETDYNNPSTKRSLSRQASNTSAKSVRFCDNGELNCQQSQQPRRICSRQSSNASCRSSRLALSEDGATNQLRIKTLSRQSSVSSMNSVSSNCSLSSTSCDINRSKMDTKPNYYQSVAKLAKNLRSNCDKILDMSVPFVIDSNLLWTISEAINDLLSNNTHPSDDDDTFSQYGSESGDPRANFEHDCMFITDFFGQTPSLCIVLSETSTIQGTIDITLFRSLHFLELRKIPVHMVAGINTIRVNLRKLKCTRCIDYLNEVFLFNGEQPYSHSQPIASTSSAGIRQQKFNASHSLDLPSSAQQQSMHASGYSAALTTLTSVWPELREIDVSFNRIEYLDTKILELTPSVEILNLSRNRISSIDSSFTRVLNSLTFLNLNYNQLTSIPPLPPNLKILLLSNNYISHLISPLVASNFKSLEIIDLSQNVISDEQQLEAFHNLSSLVSLSLIGNPISYLESYRATVSANLNRAVLNNKQFVLDKKKISNSDVRHAMEQIKKRRPMITTSFMASYGQFSSESSRFNEIKSLTQSYDSNSSSIRSACRKKAKIREVVVLDDSDEENIENIHSSRRNDPSPSSQPRRVTMERRSSPSSYKSIESISSDEKQPTLQDTKIAIESLREKYGPENWLIRQGGCEVKKLLGISDGHLKPRNGPETDLFSKSLPPQASTNASFYSAVTNFDNSSYDGSSGREFQHPRLPGVAGGEDYNSSSSTIAELTNSQKQITLQNNSDESIKCIGIDEANNSSESGLVYYSCTNLNESSRVGSANDAADVEFDSFGAKRFSHSSPSFRFFQNGQIYHLIIEDQYLYEVDPRQMQNVVSHWDLKSIKSMSQEKCSSETETVEFRIYFDTLKKNKKERSFIMTRGEYKEFEKLVEPYLQQNTMEEFSDGFQCIKCGAQFSKCLLTVKMIDKTPVQVQVCPNIECQSDLLIPLESIPLPNNESLNLDNATTDGLDRASAAENIEPSHLSQVNEKSSWGQLPFMRTSTPVSAAKTGIPQSLPNTSFMAEFFKSPLSGTPTPKIPSKSTHQMPATSPIVPASTSPSSTSDHLAVPTNNNNICVSFGQGDELAAKNPNTKSDSDVEVLSCDSSSIEVLAKNDGDDSEVEVEEALELFVPDTSGQLRKLSAITAPVMTESNSSGSFAESVCTTYEKVLGTNTTNTVGLQLSQPLNQTPTSHLSISTSASTSASSISSSATMTPTHSAASPLNATMPIKYDYQDFTKIDHRLQLFCEISVFKSRDEELLALTKALVLSTGSPYMAVVIFSNKKVYFYKLTGVETEKPETWLQKRDCFPLNKLQRLDVLIGRHGVGMDFQTGKYFALVFRDSRRTSNFFEFFLCDICTKIEPPIVQDIGQAQKALVSSSPISYFGMLRLAVCETTSKSYAVSAVVMTDDDLKIIVDMSWLIGRTGNETVTTKHEQSLKRVRQVEWLEMDTTFVRIVFQLDGNTYFNWELCFETKEEQDAFTTCLQSQVKDVPFISLSQPLEP